MYKIYKSSTIFSPYFDFILQREIWMHAFTGQMSVLYSIFMNGKININLYIYMYTYIKICLESTCLGYL